MTCKKTQGFLESTAIGIDDTVDASKAKYGNEKALELLKGMDSLVAIKGKKVVVFNLKKDRPDDATLLSHLMGPTGNLRAPTARIGKTLIVGFNDEAYKEVLGV